MGAVETIEIKKVSVPVTATVIVKLEGASSVGNSLGELQPFIEISGGRPDSVWGEHTPVLEGGRP